MIEATLLNYGVLGIWTLTMLFERYKWQKDIKEVIENNTLVLTKVYGAVKYGRRYTDRK